MDGFRFDLMGLLPTELMNRIGRALALRYGAGEKPVSYTHLDVYKRQGGDRGDELCGGHQFRDHGRRALRSPVYDQHLVYVL